MLKSNKIYFLELQREPNSIQDLPTYRQDQSSSSFQAQQQEGDDTNWWIAGAAAVAGVAATIGLIVFGATRPSNSNRN